MVEIIKESSSRGDIMAGKKKSDIVICERYLWKCEKRKNEERNRWECDTNKFK